MKANAEIVDDVVRLGIVDKAMRINRVSPIYADDLRQELCLSLLELNNERLNDIADSGKLEAFVHRTVRNMWRSKTSRFYYNFRKNEAQTTTTDYARYIPDDEG